MMTKTIKLNIAHKQIIMMFSGCVLQKTGEQVAFWKKKTPAQILHTSNILEKRAVSLRSQFDKTDFANENKEDIKRFHDMLQEDIKNMKFNLQEDNLPVELVKVAKIYLQDMNNMNEVLNICVTG